MQSSSFTAVPVINMFHFVNTELQNLWSEHQDLEGEKLPVNKVADVYWSVGYILGPTYTSKLEEELEHVYGTVTCYSDLIALDLIAI